MDIRKLQRAIVDGLEDVKAQDIAVFNTEALSPLFERVVIASGTSNRQTKALASSVRETVKSRGMQVLSTEGEENGEWIIVDCGAAVAHIMQPSIRDYYHLEEIWGGKKVAMKQAGARPSPAKQAVSTSAPAPAKKTTSAKSVPVTRKSAPARQAPPGGSAGQAAPARRAAPARKATASTPRAGAAAKQTSSAPRTGAAAKKAAPARKTAAGRPPARRKPQA